MAKVIYICARHTTFAAWIRFCVFILIHNFGSRILANIWLQYLCNRTKSNQWVSRQNVSVKKEIKKRNAIQEEKDYKKLNIKQFGEKNSVNCDVDCIAFIYINDSVKFNHLPDLEYFFQDQIKTSQPQKQKRCAIYDAIMFKSYKSFCSCCSCRRLLVFVLQYLLRRSYK